jgi:hypothetical protein
VVVSRKAIAVAGLSAIAIAAGGCGGDSDSGGELSAAFKKDFSTAPWIHHITGVKKMSSEHPNSLEVTTDLHKASDTLTGAICEAGFQFADDHELGDGIGAVVITGPDGEEGGCA